MTNSRSEQIKRKAALQIANDKINAIRVQKEVTSIPVTISSGTYYFDCSRDDAVLMFLKYQAISSGDVAAPPYWRDSNNNNVPIVANDFKLISLAIDSYIMAIGAECHRIKDNDLASASIEEFESIISDFKNYDPLA